MERKAKTKAEFSQLIAQVSKLYRESSQRNEEAFYQGKKEAFEEIMQCFISNQNGNLRYVQSFAFSQMLDEKIQKLEKNLQFIENGEEDKIIMETEVKKFDKKDGSALPNLIKMSIDEEESETKNDNNNNSSTNNTLNKNNFVEFPFALIQNNNSNNQTNRINITSSSFVPFKNRRVYK